MKKSNIKKRPSWRHNWRLPDSGISTGCSVMAELLHVEIMEVGLRYGLFLGPAL
jgi:hypothetical protein